MDVLAEIVADTRRRVAARKARTGPIAPAEAPRAGRPRFRDALTAPGVGVIAEHKRRSPSAGTIRDDLALEDVVRAYERGGAAALSILTEESRFGGTLADIEAARAVTTLPILRKDFIVDSYQVAEAADAGAAAILLIVAAFGGDREPLRALLSDARRFGLDVLVEVHDAAELDVALELGADIVGINNRDLSTLRVDLQTTYALLPHVPGGVVTVAESGFRTAEELRGLAAAGVDAVLVGEALMRSADPAAACGELADATAPVR